MTLQRRNQHENLTFAPIRVDLTVVAGSGR